MQQICLFPGTFDPITLGHVDIIKRALPLFDQIIVAIGSNSGKAPMYTTSQRQEWIEGIFKDEKRKIRRRSGFFVSANGDRNT